MYFCHTALKKKKKTYSTSSVCNCCESQGYKLKIRVRFSFSVRGLFSKVQTELPDTLIISHLHFNNDRPLWILCFIDNLTYIHMCKEVSFFGKSEFLSFRIYSLPISHPWNIVNKFFSLYTLSFYDIGSKYENLYKTFRRTSSPTSPQFC